MSLKTITHEQMQALKIKRVNDDKLTRPGALQGVRGFVVVRLWPTVTKLYGQAFEYLCIRNSTYSTERERWYDSYVCNMHWEKATVFESFELADAVGLMIAGRWPTCRFFPFPVIVETTVEGHPKDDICRNYPIWVTSRVPLP